MSNFVLAVLEPATSKAGLSNEVYKYELNDYQNSEYAFFVRKLNEIGLFRVPFSEPHSLYNEREEYAAIIECHK